MEAGKSILVFALTLTLILSVIGQISAKPAGAAPSMEQQQWSSHPDLPHYELHPIDNCIFACDHCFKGDSLVKCANECILTEAIMSIEWITTCPYLARQYTHASSLTNPFRH